jgi:molecular chaperone GrpE
MNGNGNGNPTESAHPDFADPESARSQETPSGAGAAAPEALRRERDEQRDLYLRAVAELDNFRKRSARELDNARKYGAERLAQALLPVRDSLEAGLAATEKAGQTALLEGQQATLRLMDDAFASCGIREINPVGQPFDPSKHEALSAVPTGDAPPDTVLEVVQKGYELHDRLLRAAKVLVAKGEGP